MIFTALEKCMVVLEYIPNTYGGSWIHTITMHHILRGMFLYDTVNYTCHTSSKCINRNHFASEIAHFKYNNEYTYQCYN